MKSVATLLSVAVLITGCANTNSSGGAASPSTSTANTSTFDTATRDAALKAALDACRGFLEGGTLDASAFAAAGFRPYRKALGIRNGFEASVGSETAGLLNITTNYYLRVWPAEASTLGARKSCDMETNLGIPVITFTDYFSTAGYAVTPDPRVRGGLAFVKEGTDISFFAKNKLDIGLYTYDIALNE